MSRVFFIETHFFSVSEKRVTFASDLCVKMRRET